MRMPPEPRSAAARARNMYRGAGSPLPAAATLGMAVLACCSCSGATAAQEASDGIPAGSIVAGKFFPFVGFGTAARLGEDDILAALRAGYRLVDSAQATEWYSEADAGRAVSRFVAEGGVGSRDELWVTTKIHPRDHGAKRAEAAVRRSLAALQTDVVDLVLLHYPRCWPELCGADHVDEGTFYDSWRALERLVDEGAVRALGVSNFAAHELVALHDFARVKPAVVQSWMDPFHQDADVRRACKERNILYQAYSSLGSQWQYRPRSDSFGPNPVFGHSDLQRAAQRRGWSVARLVLGWQLQSGVAVIPRARGREHLCDNAAVFGGCEGGGNSGEGGVLLADGLLSSDELAAIDALDGALERPHSPHDL